MGLPPVYPSRVGGSQVPAVPEIEEHLTNDKVPDEEKGVFKEIISLETFKDAKRDFTSFEPVFELYLKNNSVKNTDFTLIVGMRSSPARHHLWGNQFVP
ncbi:MAG: hypothetical protein C5B58_15180 [Acidobacteria bacterium]|nr:MAG: hypothetical protein C5B58_15180 [Acidobacteriota bacterium]